jgi:uncharacterized protein
VFGKESMIQLPLFPYHRDPIASGSVEEASVPCPCCGQIRGVIYTGVTYSRERLEGLCPWCIADGSASRKFGASFFDADFCDDDGERVSLDAQVHEEVFGRTIGFATFNPIGWWIHCGVPAEYVKRNEPYDMVFECRKCHKQHVIHDLD